MLFRSGEAGIWHSLQRLLSCKHMEAVAAGLPLSGGHGTALVLKEQLGGAPWGAEAQHGAPPFFCCGGGWAEDGREKEEMGINGDFVDCRRIPANVDEICKFVSKYVRKYL